MDFAEREPHLRLLRGTFFQLQQQRQRSLHARMVRAHDAEGERERENKTGTLQRVLESRTRDH